MRIYILEDEAKILSHIISLVEKIPCLELIGTSDSVKKAKLEIPLLDPEMILADIELKDGNSFEIFSEIETEAHIVFITAFSHYAIDALNLGALAYLLKPVNATVFTETMERCCQKIECFNVNKRQVELSLSQYNGKTSLSKLALKSINRTLIVNVEDILYCQGNKGYTTFFLKNDKPIMVSRVLKEFEALLSQNLFLRCHQSFLINAHYIKTHYSEGFIEMTNKTMIPISIRKKSIVQDFINQLGNS